MTQAPVGKITIEDDRTGLEVPTLRRAIEDNLFYVQGKFPAIATTTDIYMAVAYTVRDRLLRRWLNSIESYMKKDVKVVCYLSVHNLQTIWSIWAFTIV